MTVTDHDHRRQEKAALATGNPEEIRGAARRALQRDDVEAHVRLDNLARCAEGDHCWHLRNSNMDRDVEATGVCCHCDLRLRVLKQKVSGDHGEHRWKPRVGSQQVFRFATFKQEAEPYEPPREEPE